MAGQIHLFQAGNSAQFGLTHEADGKNLPQAANGLPWRYIETAKFQRGSGSPTEWQARVAAIQAGLNLNGYFITEREHLPEGVFSCN